MRRLLLLGLGGALVVPVFAQTTAPTSVAVPGETTAQGDIAVTIYQNGPSLVQDTRQMNLPIGRSKQEFPDVSALIRPETVTLTGPGIGIVEQNFDYDLLTPATLMEKAVGQTITLLRINPATGAETRLRAKVLAANDGVVLQIGDTIEVLRDDGLPVRVIFDKVPPNLRARPTLSVTLESKGGVTPTTLTYLTPELGWTSDYVTLFDDAKQTIDVQGWVTLTNNTGTDYTNADVLLVANNPNQGGGRRSFQTPYNPSTRPGPRATTGSGSAIIISTRSPSAQRYPMPNKSRSASST